jgi:dTDP-4-dehydrorhamnose 3,5-epimerase
MINGVAFKELITHTDERGFFREVIRSTDDFFKEGFAQCSHAVVYAGVTKAWHVHNIQIDWWYVISGVLKVALHDTRKNSPTFRETMEFLMGDDQPARALRIPQGVAHGYTCISGPAHVLYIMSHVHNPQDEGRIRHDDPEIGYDWTKGPAIK